MPTIQFESCCAYNFNFFLGCCASSVNMLKQQITDFTFDNKYDLFRALCKSTISEKVDLLACLSYCIQDFEYVEDSFYCGQSAIDVEVFELFCDYISIACGYNSFEILETKKKLREMTDFEREWEKKRLEHEAKIKAAKAKQGKGTELDIVIASIMREFGVSIKDIFQMNKYSLFFLYSQVGKIANYEVTKIAAGTGNLSRSTKHQYWANQK